ncbi:protein of unknown function (plasmid) [Rhodovastum atsumiense]|nr:protein of unknown function [Rhodovastum atsumiense]
MVPEAMRDDGGGTLIAPQGCGTIISPENGPPRHGAQPCRKRSFVERLVHAEASMKQAGRADRPATASRRS